MKRIVILMGLSLLISLGGYAQKSKRTSAYMYNKNGEYKKAKEAIDEALKNEKTMNDAKTWLYAGEIYYNIASQPGVAELLKVPDAAMKSYEALKKAKELDVKGSYKDEIALELVKLTNVFYKIGADDFKNGNYKGAVDIFKIAYDIGNLRGETDTISAFNVGMAGVYANDPKSAAEYLKKCVDMNFNDPKVYIYYNRALKQLGDTVKAEEVIKIGRKRFPSELSLLLEQAQIYLERGETDKLQKSLLEAIEKDPKNANLYFLLGKTYDDEDSTNKAESYYTKATEINPEFFEAYYNIGAIYVNKAAALQSQANDLPLNETEKYNKITEEANANLAKAVPYLEKSLEIKPDDKPTISALKEAYARLKMNDKLKVLNDSINK